MVMLSSIHQNGFAQINMRNVTSKLLNNKIIDFDLNSIDEIYFKYSSLAFAKRYIDKSLYPLLFAMIDGISNPLITFRVQNLEKGFCFGHGRPHLDGMGKKDEIHRLYICGDSGTKTDFSLMPPGNIWEFGGDLLHAAAPVSKSGKRMLLRVSQCNLSKRDFIEKSMPTSYIG